MSAPAQIVSTLTQYVVRLKNPKSSQQNPRLNLAPPQSGAASMTMIHVVPPRGGASVDDRRLQRVDSQSLAKILPPPRRRATGTTASIVALALPLNRRHRPLFVAASSAIVISLALAGCASSPVDYQGLASANQLQRVKDDEEPFQFHNSDAQFANYSKILIDPVTVYTGTDAQFGSHSQDDRKAIAAYMQKTVEETLGKRYQLVNAPGPNTLRLHLTLTGIETSTPVISTLSHLLPVGLVVNTGLQVTDHNGTFFGSVSYAAELSDASTGELLYAYVTRQTPDALDVTASFGSLAAAREGVRIGANHLRDQLAKDGMRAGS
jgi:hypothetical protein